MAGRTSAAVLVVILAGFLLLLRSAWSPAWFGFSHDDSLYLSSGLALARGEGYRMPSVPGEPLQTKYPLLFPWMLSLIWRWDAAFPGNLATAFWVNAVFGCAFLTGAWAFLRQLGAGRKAALALTVVCAAHPQLQNLSGMLLSDIAFMALALWSLVAAQAGLPRMMSGGQRAWTYWMAAAALVGLAVLTRSLGVAVAAGLAAAALYRRSPKAALVPVVTAAAAISPALARAWSSAGVDQELTGGAGFRETMLFYTSYLGFWKLSVPDLATFWDQLLFNFLEFLKTPATLTFLVPAGGFAPGLWQALAIALSVGVLRGVWRGASADGLAPAHFAFLFYSLVILAWNYTLMERFLLLFLPLFLHGALEEFGMVWRSGREAIRGAAPLGDRVAAGLMLAVLTGLLTWGVCQAGWRIPTAVRRATAVRETLAEEKREAYAWVKAHTAESDRVISYEDVSLFLNTGRQGLRPIATSTASFFRQRKSILDEELRHLSDTAVAIEASYWLVSSDDYHLESGEEFLRTATSELLGRSEVAFSSSGGGVRIHRIAWSSAGGAEQARPGGEVQHSESKTSSRGISGGL